MHSEYASLKKHELITPCKAWVNNPTFTVDEVAHTHKVGNKRIHVERAFRRAQEWKILHGLVPLTRVDIWGAVWFVCCMMSNFGPPMIREGVDGLPSLAEIQWGAENEVGRGVELPCTTAQAQEIATAHAEASAMAGRAAILRANAAAIAGGAQSARVLQAAAVVRGGQGSGAAADSGASGGN